jgi:hypothetical protein
MRSDRDAAVINAAFGWADQRFTIYREQAEKNLIAALNDLIAPKRALAADEQVQVRAEPHESSPAPPAGKR